MNNNLFQDLLDSTVSPLVIFIRLAVGLVFFPEGIQKLIYPEIYGAGRFKAIGILYPKIMGPFVGWLELICGLFILLGLFTRLVSLILAILMVMSFISAQIPIWIGTDWAPHALKPQRYGFWSFMHEARSDWAMLMGSCYLLVVGAGSWSIDAFLT